MRQVNEAELVWGIKYRLSRLSKTVRKNLASDVGASRDFAIQFIAEHLVKESLGRYEVLSDTADPPGDLFSRAAYGGGIGSAPMIDEDRIDRG